MNKTIYKTYILYMSTYNISVFYGNVFNYGKNIFRNEIQINALIIKTVSTIGINDIYHHNLHKYERLM